MSISRRDFWVGRCGIARRRPECAKITVRRLAMPSRCGPSSDPSLFAQTMDSTTSMTPSSPEERRDTLDAAMRVVNGPENDPFDDSVGLAVCRTKKAVVELDACCMHGPTRRAGSRRRRANIKNVSLVAKAVIEHTGHVMLVGEGAERFAVAMGFPAENAAHRALAENLAVVEGISLERRLVGAWTGLAAVEGAGDFPALRALEERIRAWKSAPLRSVSNPNFGCGPSTSPVSTTGRSTAQR